MKKRCLNDFFRIGMEWISFLKRMSVFIGLFVFGCLFMPDLFGQNFNGKVKLFSRSESNDKSARGLRKKVSSLSANQQMQRQVLVQKPEKLQFEVPVDGQWVTLELHKAEIFSADAAVQELDKDGKAKPIKPLSMVHYRGKVAGEKSLAGLTFFEDEILGVIDRPSGTWNIGHQKKRTEPDSVLFIFNSDDIENKEVFECFTNDDISQVTPPSAGGPATNGTPVGFPVDMYIETDFSCFINNNFNTQSVTKWVAGMMNLVSAIYANEDIVLQIKTLNIWTAPDPYESYNSTGTMLPVFAARMAGGFSGDLAHLFSQRSIGGGIAYLNVLCGTANQRVGISGAMDNTYIPVNDYDWNIKVVTHEIGHNLGSPHTHKCGFWANGLGIDSCGPKAGYPEGTCKAPTPPSGGGTIMSYCHLTNTGVRLSNGFGTQPGNYIRSRVLAASCLNNCANLKVVEIDTSYATCAAPGTATVIASGGVAPLTYLWSNGATTSSVNNLAKGNHFVTVKSATAGCQVVKGFTIGEITGTCPTITGFTPKNGIAGSAVTITGLRFTGATAVKFGTTAATNFTVVNSSTITATLGPGSSGNISVSNASGTGALGDFIHCANTVNFSQPLQLRTISANFDTVGNNRATNCFTNQFRTNSIPGHPNARPGADVFYKFKTGPCVYSLDVGVCLDAGTAMIWILDSVGNVLRSSTSGVIAGCTGYGATVKDLVVSPNSNYYAVVESYYADSDLPWLLSFRPNSCTPPVISSFTPAAAEKDSTVTINGNYFSNTVSVKFNGVSASIFEISSPTKILVKVPVGAAAGKLSVTTPMGTAYSSNGFSLKRNTGDMGYVKLCPGGTVTLTASRSGTQYQWVTSAGDGETPVVNNANYAGATTRNLTITNAPTYWYNYMYRCLVDGSVAGFPAYLQFVNSFTGTVNNVWENADNWGCVGKLADANTDVVVLGGNPVLASNTFARSLTLNPGVNLTANSGFKLGLGNIYQNVPVNRLYGGSASEMAASIIPTPDGGWVMAGTSSSSYSGNVTNTGNGGNDCWIVKMDGGGRILWNRLLGGSGQDRSVIIQPTKDGGYILVANSTSAIVGFNSGYNKGGTDIYVAKLDAEGYVVWNRLFGGSSTDEAADILQTPDGGYMVAGTSFSSASGDVTGNNHGSADYWVMKLTATGAISWQKLYGGSLEDRCKGIVENEGGYIIAGHTYSSANGDVTAVNKGVRDFWVVKIDQDGDIIWNNLIGGNGLEELESIAPTRDGGFVMAGLSSSSANGNVTATTKGSVDYWIVKCDVDGAIEWNKLYGGTQAERATCIRQTSDNGYIVTGFSGSSNTGNVTGAIVGAGTYDYWTIKLDAAGALSWNKLMGGNDYDQPYGVCETSDGNFVVAGYTSSSNTGQLTGVFSKGQSDCWIIKLKANGAPW